MPFWCCAQLESGHINFALHCLQQLGYTTYAPRLRTVRVSHGRKIESRPLLFFPYVFVAIVSQWHAARWAPGVRRLVMAGDAVPARVPDDVVDGLRRREVGGAIELAKPPRFRRGDKVRITRGPFRAHLALYEGQTAHERVAVLLRLLGGRTRADLPADAIEPVP